MLRLWDATGGVFVCHSRHNGTEILKVRVFMLIEHYDMLQETSSCGLENSAVRHQKPEYAKRTRLVGFLYAGTSAKPIVNIKAFTDAKVHSSIPWQMFNGKCVKN